MTDLQLHTDFPDYTREDWKALAEKGLRGGAFETLISKTEDGLVRGPLFDARSDDASIEAMPRHGAPLLEGRPWHICAPVTDEDDDFANSQLLDDLKGGASAVFIARDGFSRTADIRRLLEGVYTNLVPLLVAPGSEAASIILKMDELKDRSVLLGLDPLGDRPDMPETWRAFTIDAATPHEDGATDAQALAIFAAIAAEAFRTHGRDVNEDLSAQFALGTDAHLGLIKLRAARRIYATIASAYGIDKPSIPFHALSSLRMMQNEDAWTNLLRTMSAGFGAVTGGAEYITLRPFTETPADRRLGDATAFAYRIARNQQLLMMEESHLGQVQDAAHGSYFHETMTDRLAEEAWSLFQSIEASGGYTAYRASGQYDADMARSRTERAERGDPVLGVTLHPAEGVKAPEVR